MYVGLIRLGQLVSDEHTLAEAVLYVVMYSDYSAI